MIRAAILHAFDWSGRARRRDFWAMLVMAIFLLGGVAVLEVWLAGSTIHAPRWVFLLAALVIIPLIATAVRRLHDRGQSGGWLVFAAVPVVGLLLPLYLLLAPGTPRADGPETPFSLHFIGILLAILTVLLVASRAFWTPYWVPSASMQPTLLIGDYLMARHIAPDAALRGDIVVFRHPARDETDVSRLIGLPGDTVQMAAGGLVLNGRPVPQTDATPFTQVNLPQGPTRQLPRCGNAPVGAGGQCITPRRRETLPDGPAYDVLDLLPASATDDTQVFTVPPGHVFVIGDNRDDSLDSRTGIATGGVGLVRMPNIIARVDRVLFSAATSFPAVWNWRADRLLMALP